MRVTATEIALSAVALTVGIFLYAFAEASEKVDADRKYIRDHTYLEQVIVVAKHEQGTPSVEVRIAGDGPWYKIVDEQGAQKTAWTTECVMWSVNVPVGADVMLISFKPDSHKETWIGLDTEAKGK